MTSTSKIAAELLSTYINLIDPEFKAHICINGEFDNDDSSFADSYRVFYDGKIHESPTNPRGNFFTVYSLRNDPSKVFLNFEHKETEGIQELLEFAFNQTEFAESAETIWSSEETNWIVDLNAIIELIEDFKNPYDMPNSDLGIKAEYEKNRALREHPLDESRKRFTESMAIEEDVDILQLKDDWIRLLTKVEDYDPYIINLLRAVPIKYFDDLGSTETVEHVAKFSVNLKNATLELDVSEIFFELKGEVAVGILLHELAHAIVMLRYLLAKDMQGYAAYVTDNGGHNFEWREVADDLETYFDEKIKVAESLDMDDPDIYEYALEDTLNHQALKKSTEDDIFDENGDIDPSWFTESKHRLTEADKSRFINKVWPQIECSPTDVMERVSQELDEPKSRLPDKESIIQFANSSAADSYKIDWNKFNSSDNDTLWNATIHLLVSFFLNLENKVLKTDPKTMFKDKKDFKILHETEKWLFVGMLTYKAAQFADSFQCGGAGAKWCIGQRGDDRYWEDYVNHKNERFVLAYNKTIYGNPNNQKYMIQLRPVNDADVNVTVWEQTDNPKLNLYGNDALNFFDFKDFKIFNKWYFSIQPKTESVKTFSLGETQRQKIRLDTDFMSDFIILKNEDKDGLNFSYAKMINNINRVANNGEIKQLISVGSKCTEGVKDNLDLGYVRLVPANPPEMQTIIDSAFHPSITIEGYKSVHLRSLWVSYNSPFLAFRNCDKVVIDCVYMPLPAYSPEDYKDYFIARDFKGAIRENDCNVSFGDCDIEIKNIKIMPSRYSIMDVGQLGPDPDVRVSLMLDDLGDRPVKITKSTFHRIFLNLNAIEEETNAPATDFSKHTFYLDKAIQWNENTSRIYIFNAPEDWTITCTDPKMQTPELHIYGSFKEST